METKGKRHPLSAEKEALLKWRARGDTRIIAEQLKVTSNYVMMVLNGHRQNYRVWIELSQLVQNRAKANREVSATAFQVLIDAGIEQILIAHAGKISSEELEEMRAKKQFEFAAIFEELTEGGRKLSEQIQIIKQNLEAENRAKT